MADPLVLVHSPLVGPDTWEPVAAVLARHGRDVRVADLTAAGTGGPPYASRQADAIARAASSQPAVLVGHSRAGPLLAPAGSALGRVAGYLFVDARLPEPGRSWLSTVSAERAAELRQMAGTDGRLPPWFSWWGDDEALAELLPDPLARRRFCAGCPRLPLTMLEEVMPAASLLPQASAAYLRLSAAYDGEADRARLLGWPVGEMDSHHLALVTDPERVASLLLELVAAMDKSANVARDQARPVP